MNIMENDYLCNIKQIVKNGNKRKQRQGRKA